MTTKKRGRPAKAKESTYSISIRIGAETLTGKGDTVLEALASVPRPQKLFSKVFLELTDGKRKMEKMYFPKEGKRLFYPLVQRYSAKNLEFLLK